MLFDLLNSLFCSLLAFPIDKIPSYISLSNLIIHNLRTGNVFYFINNQVIHLTLW